MSAAPGPDACRDSGVSPEVPQLRGLPSISETQGPSNKLLIGQRRLKRETTTFIIYRSRCGHGHLYINHISGSLTA